MKKMNKKGFTLIELLAVIVILGLLMAIAIPSVTKYINQSRKKTLASTIANYIQAVSVQVNNGDDQFTDSSIYAIPIECISLEKGGKNPFGDWAPVSSNYWAYVLVQPNGDSYTYGFTFKDSANYGMWPTSIKNMDSSGNYITTDAGSKLNKPTLPTPDSPGKVLYPPAWFAIGGLANKDKWNGFDIDGDQVLVVYQAENQINSEDKAAGLPYCKVA